jgi:hypothetical protein
LPFNQELNILPNFKSSPGRHRARNLLVQLLNLRANPLEIHCGALHEQAWDDLVKLALKQGVAPLLYRRLRQAPAGIPPRILQELNEEYLATALRNMQLVKELSRVVKTLRAANLDPLVLKGAHIAQVAYGNIALRPMNDLDILVERADLTRAEQAVAQLGYVAHPDFPDREWAIENHYHLCYSLPQEGIILELHWEMEIPGSPFKARAADLLRRAVPISLAGIPTYVLTCEDLILNLCTQISYHHVFSYAALRSLFDLAYVIEARAHSIDWETLQTRAVEWRARRCAHLALLLAHEIAGADVPNRVLEILAPDQFDPLLAEWATDRILMVEEQVTDPVLASTISDGFGNVWTSRHLRGKLATLVKTCFPPKKKMAELYALSPDSRQIYLQYPRRIQDLSVRYARHIWSLIQRDESTRAWIEREGKRTALMRWITANDLN